MAKAKAQLHRRRQLHKRYIGLDPGINGAVVVLREPVERITFDLLPVLKSGKGGRKELDLAELLMMLKKARSDSCLAVLEKVSAMPRQGVTSMFRFGDSFGVLRALAFAAEIPTVVITPQSWKKEVGLVGKPKEASLVKAQEMWPHADFGRNKALAVNMADAALMALYAKRRGL